MRHRLLLIGQIRAAVTTWTEGLTQADRHADLETMTPEWGRRVRTNMLAVVEHLHRYAPSCSVQPGC